MLLEAVVLEPSACNPTAVLRLPVVFEPSVPSVPFPPIATLPTLILPVVVIVLLPKLANNDVALLLL